MEFINQRETKNLEFKEDDSSKTYFKTISAFANYSGGKIIFGITDDGKIKGVQNPNDFCLNIENAINDNIKPIPEYQLFVNNKNNTVELEIKSGLFKPYFYKNKAYKRNDSSTIEVDRMELNQLILEGSNLSFDETSSSAKNLTFEELANKSKEILGLDLFDENTLKTMGLVSSSGVYSKAAELLADNNSFSGIDIVRFGNNSDEIYERKTVENISVLGLLDVSYDMFRKYYQYEKIEGEYRSCIDRIPENAFRETIANAIVHRNWDVKANIKISFYEDCIEIISPGGLVSGISEEEYLEGRFSILRNPLLGDVFCRLKIIEKFGTGIKRIKNAYSTFNVRPYFSVTQNSILVKLPVIDKIFNFTQMEESVLKIIQKERLYSRQEIEILTGYNKDKVIRILNALNEKDAIEKQGEGKACLYKRK